MKIFFRRGDTVGLFKDWQTGQVIAEFHEATKYRGWICLRYETTYYLRTNAVPRFE